MNETTDTISHEVELEIIACCVFTYKSPILSNTSMWHFYDKFFQIFHIISAAYLKPCCYNSNFAYNKNSKKKNWSYPI